MSEPDPANPQPFVNFPSEVVRQRLDNRLRSLPIQDAIRQSLSKELGAFLNADTLNATFRDLVIGRTSLDQSLQNLATQASQVLDTVMQAEQQRLNEELRIQQQLQDALQPGEAPRRRKNYIVRGQVLHERTQEPLAGLLVQATDRDVRKDDFLGLAITDASGRFEISFGTQAFREGGENLPEVMLQVGVDRQTPLYQSATPLVVRPKEPTTTTIVLSAEQADLALSQVSIDPQNLGVRLQTLNRAIAYTQYQHLQAQTLGNVLKAELAQFLNSPQA